MSAEIRSDSRLPLVDIETMEGAAGAALRASPRRLNIIAMMAHAKTCVLPQLAVGRAVMTEQSLPPLPRELLILLAARLDGGRYVWSQHRTIAERLGATSAMVDAIDALDLASTAFGETDQALLSFGTQVIRGGDVEDAVFERVSRHFTAQEIVEAIIAIGYYMTMNRLTLVTRTPLEIPTTT
ncbi:carboxymuconolactone decarboxylase family protein [Amycolatopsis pithecellobii]|uniref:Carboxymuconolactone decarboxylase family protein n=1 Tax=Amycolatopsis pithecellobii TaxID=664692 RepID=A0A6N7ZB84_9PSEU|nr:carboxymuconolactone decarboxylase family protein [Amycolatopsis pithecellobii]MTD58948.1 carboxymuconolactone decarboxylase family protein [Amycolatopsis pithecellobii]